MAVGGASVALAVVAYRATLHIGLFSDDAVLLTRAAGWHLGWVGDQLLRPLPMGIWALVLSAGGGGLTLHLLNVVAHGVNAFLVYRVGRGQHLGVTPALLATAVFVLSPLATEPVVWISGYFDVLMTLLCCLAVLAARGYSGRRALGSRLALWVIVPAAFLTKETAVVLPAVDPDRHRGERGAAIVPNPDHRLRIAADGRRGDGRGSADAPGRRGHSGTALEIGARNVPTASH